VVTLFSRRVHIREVTGSNPVSPTSRAETSALFCFLNARFLILAVRADNDSSFLLDMGLINTLINPTVLQKRTALIRALIDLSLFSFLRV